MGPCVWPDTGGVSDGKDGRDYYIPCWLLQHLDALRTRLCGWRPCRLLYCTGPADCPRCNVSGWLPVQTRLASNGAAAASSLPPPATFTAGGARGAKHIGYGRSQPGSHDRCVVHRFCSWVRNVFKCSDPGAEMRRLSFMAWSCYCPPSGLFRLLQTDAFCFFSPLAE